MGASPMSEMLANAEKEVLVETVKLAQKLGLRGVKGGWKDYLQSHDKKFGAGLSDPAKRSKDILVAFLETFTLEKDRKVFNRILSRQRDRAAMDQFIKDFPDKETPLQRLVRLTVEHPLYVQNYSFPSHDEEWMVVPLGKVSKAMKSKMMIAVDCEMVLCEDGTEALVRVCAVDQNLEVKFDKIVKINKVIADYRTDITGIIAEDLEGVTCSLNDIQIELKKLLSHGTILIGHSLHNDLKALKIDHPRVVDTACIFKYKNLPNSYAPSLNNLCKSVLGYEIREEDEPHDCLCDAESAMKLVLAKLEHGFDDPIKVAVKNMKISDLAKLLLHKIPVKVPCQELRSAFPMEYTIELETDSRARGQYYSTLALFKNASEADAAFARIKGKEKMDTCGRLQKLVPLSLSTGEAIFFYIRKMGVDGLLDDSEQPKKRPSSTENDLEDSKRQKTQLKKRPASTENDLEDSKRQKTSLNQCDHVKEIQRLKLELQNREKEIVKLQKILCKHGL